MPFSSPKQYQPTPFVSRNEVQNDKPRWHIFLPCLKKCATRPLEQGISTAEYSAKLLSLQQQRYTWINPGFNNSHLSQPLFRTKKAWTAFNELNAMRAFRFRLLTSQITSMLVASTAVLALSWIYSSTIGVSSLSHASRQSRILMRQMLPFQDISPHKRDIERGVETLIHAIFHTVSSAEDVVNNTRLEIHSDAQPRTKDIITHENDSLTKPSSTLHTVAGLFRHYSIYKTLPHESMVSLWQGFVNPEVANNSYNRNNNARNSHWTNSKMTPITTPMLRSIAKIESPFNTFNDAQDSFVMPKWTYPIIPSIWELETPSTSSSLNLSYFIGHLGANTGLSPEKKLVSGIANGAVAFSGT